MAILLPLMLTGAQPGCGASTVVVVVGGTVVVVVGGTVVVGAEVEGGAGAAEPCPAGLVPEHAAAVTAVAVTTAATPIRADQDRRPVPSFPNWCTGDVYHSCPCH